MSEEPKSCAIHGGMIRNGKCYGCLVENPAFAKQSFTAECSCGNRLDILHGATRVVCPNCCEVWAQRPALANGDGRELKWLS